MKSCDAEKKKSIYEIEIVPQFMSNQVGNEQYFNFFGYLSPKQSLFAFLHLYHLASTISVYDWGGLKGGNCCIFAHKYPLLPFTSLESSPPSSAPKITYAIESWAFCHQNWTFWYQILVLIVSWIAGGNSETWFCTQFFCHQVWQLLHSDHLFLLFATFDYLYGTRKYPRVGTLLSTLATAWNWPWRKKEN